MTTGTVDGDDDSGMPDFAAWREGEMSDGEKYVPLAAGPAARPHQNREVTVPGLPTKDALKNAAKQQPKSDFVGRFVTVAGICAIIIVLAYGMHVLNGPRDQDGRLLLSIGAWEDKVVHVAIAVSLTPVVAFVGIYWLLTWGQWPKEALARLMIATLVSTLILILGCGGLAFQMLKWLGQSLA